MFLAIRVQILDEVVCISRRFNTFGKGMDLAPAMGKIVG